jgi:hypothetical protein
VTIVNASRVPHMQRAAVAFAAALASAAPCAGEVRARVDRVPCVPGGVAAIPVQRTEGEPWPARIDVRVGELVAPAVLVWVGMRPDDGARWWTRSPEQFDAAAVAEMPSEPAPESVGEVFAMVTLPASGEGSLEIGGVPLRADWLPPPRRVRADAPVLQVPATFAEDRPDPGAPAEFWRWSLLAERQGARIGEPRGDSADRLLARYLEGLWLGGLERVRAVSPGVHAELIELLTGTAEDQEHGRTVAAWIARPAELQALLAILVDGERLPAAAAQSALTWARERWTCTPWVEQDAGDRVLLAIANPTGGDRVIRVSWRNGGPDSVPTAIVARPRRITRAWVDRLPLAPAAGAPVAERTRAESLDAVDAGIPRRIDVGAREYPVQPPGLPFGLFVPTLSLAEAQAGAIEPPDEAWRTTMSLRKRGERWEVFVEAFRPAGATAPSDDHVTILLGDPASPTHAFTVSADGSLDMRAGDDEGVAAGFMSWDDRWRARVELPEAWLPSAMPGARPMLLSAQRTPGSVRGRQTAGIVRPAWLPASPVLVDLGAWDDLGR